MKYLVTFILDFIFSDVFEAYFELSVGCELGGGGGGGGRQYVPADVVYK